MNKDICCDASVLINFLKINRIDLFAKCMDSFYITDHVCKEVSVSYPNQRLCLEAGLDQNILKEVHVTEEREFALFAELRKSDQLGAGECAAIAVASHRGYYLAIDDHQAIKKAAALFSPSSILRTQDLIVLMIQEQVLKIEEADRLIEVWAVQHRFKLKIRSFRELMHSSVH